MFSENGIKRVKKGSSAHGKRDVTDLQYTYTEHQIHVESGHPRKKPNHAPPKASNGKKLAKITNNNHNYGHNGQCHITSPSRKKQHQQSVYNENFDKYDSNPIYQQQIRQQEKLLRQQERQHSQQNTIWIDRRKNRIVCHEDEDNDDNPHSVQRVGKYQANAHKNKHSKSNKPQEFKINKIMMSEKRNSIQSSSTNETSSNDSNRCIRNNSYLNANHIVSQQHVIGVPSVAVRPSSSTSNSSSSSKMVNNKAKVPKMTNANSNSNRHLHQIQLEIINEKTNVSTPNMANVVSMPDYASYEITVWSISNLI